jgi:hypothetical protein
LSKTEEFCLWGSEGRRWYLQNEEAVGSGLRAEGPWEKEGGNSRKEKEILANSFNMTSAHISVRRI